MANPFTQDRPAQNEKSLDTYFSIINVKGSSHTVHPFMSKITFSSRRKMKKNPKKIIRQEYTTARAYLCVCVCVSVRARERENDDDDGGCGAGGRVPGAVVRS